MKIAEAAKFAELTIFAEQIVPDRVKTALDLAREIFAEAEERKQPFLYLTAEKWTKRWLPSRKFHLMKLPLNAAALPCQPKGENLVLKKIYAREEKPIVVDYNKNQVGAAMHGFVPPIVVIDGKHRFKAATMRGDSHILAWVGEEAVQEMHAMGMNVNCNCGKKIHAAGGGAGGGAGAGASGGTGGGPAPERTTGAPGASLVAKKKKLAGEGVKIYDMKVHKVIDASAPPGDNCEEMVKALKKTAGSNAGAFKIAWAHYNEHGTCAKTKGK
jgi:hypothetical protein